MARKLNEQTIALPQDPSQDNAAHTLERAGHPVVRINVGSPQDLGQEFFRFEIATAVAGAVLGINPFDQPDVEASKVATRAMTDAFEKTGSLPSEPPVCVELGLVLYTDERNAHALRQEEAEATLQSWLKAHLAPACRRRLFCGFGLPRRHRRPDAIAATAARSGARSQTRCDRPAIRPALPAFERTGYKGGPNSGVFLEITGEPHPDLEIPGRKASFGVIEAAQARGDFRVLAERGRRALHAHITGNVDDGLATISEAIEQALQ